MYNKYKTRNSGRFNKPGNFISTGEVSGASSRSAPTWLGRQLPGSVGGAGQRSNNTMPPRTDFASANYGAQQHAEQEQYGSTDQSTGEAQSEQPPLPAPPSGADMLKSDDIDMKTEPNAKEDADGAGQDTPSYWRKAKLAGVKRPTNKERRRRQNESLRRLLTPKNALMVLNEMIPTEHVAPQFKVEPVGGASNYKPGSATTFCADLALDGDYFKGFGDNKIAARNAAAEQAVRNFVIRRMNKAMHSDGSMSEGGGEGGEEEPLPMIQLASFALHKLFAEWEYEGYKVPGLRPQGSDGHDTSSEASYARPTKRHSGAGAGAGVRMGAGAGAGVRMGAGAGADMRAGAGAGAGMGAGAGTGRPAPRPKKPRLLPLNAAAMHPCMLLTYMRPKIEYRELAAEGIKPQYMTFTFGVDVDGTTYVGKASNKKEARRAAARSACQEAFGVEFDDAPTATIPVVAPDE